MNRGKNIGETIKNLRKDKGLTQKQLAEAIGVSTITIQNYENNRREPNIETLQKIGMALNVFIFKFDEDIEDIKGSQEYYLEQYLKTLNCEFIYDDSRNTIFDSPEGQFEVSKDIINDFNESINCFIKFKISEIIKNNKKINK